jgi:hypothetical protein
MGGLAIRFSASGQYAAQPNGASLGGVVTIDTPHLGSPWDNMPAAQLQQDWTQFENGNGHGSLGKQAVTARSRLPRRTIVPLAATASRALPAVASHAIGFAEP